MRRTCLEVIASLLAVVFRTPCTAAGVTDRGVDVPEDRKNLKFRGSK